MEIRELFSKEGRANRLEYWLILGASFAMIVATLNLDAPLRRSDSFLVMLFSFLFPMMALTWLVLCVALRRLHDFDCSGGWMFVPAIGWRLIVIAVHVAGYGRDVADIVIGSLGAAGLVAIGLLEGTPGDNRYGPAKRLSRQ